MRIDEYPTEPRYTATVLSTECISGDGAETQVWELVLEVDDHEFNFNLGQSIGAFIESDMPIQCSGIKAKIIEYGRNGVAGMVGHQQYRLAGYGVQRARGLRIFY